MKKTLFLSIFLILGRSGWANLPTICDETEHRAVENFTAVICGQQKYTHSFGANFEFVMEPSEKGWMIAIYQHGSQENLARLTPLWKGLINPRQIDGWHFQTTTAPKETRRFIFSPEVGHTIGKKRRKGSSLPSEKEMMRIRNFGQGEIIIQDYGLADLNPGQRARMVYIQFQVCLSWPKDYKGK